MSFEQGIMTEGMKQIFSDSKRTVTLYRATKTETNISGTESISYGNAEEVEIIFFKTEERFTLSFEGLVELGDCVLFDKPNNISIQRNDKVIADGEAFLIKTVRQWKSRELHVYDAAIGYKV